MKFDWGNPLHWIVFFVICAMVNIFYKPITMAVSGIGLAMRGLGTVPIMVLGGGAKVLTAPELGTYSVPGNVGGPLPEAIALDELNPGNE